MDWTISSEYSYIKNNAQRLSKSYVMKVEYIQVNGSAEHYIFDNRIYNDDIV